MPSLSFPLSGPLGGDVTAIVTAGATAPVQPRDFQINLGTNELVVTNGDLQLVGGLQSVAQDVQMASKFYLGEWYDDLASGLDHLGELADKRITDDRRRAIYRAHFLSRLGVTLVENLVLSFESRTRRMTVNTTLQVDLSQLNVSTEVSQ